MTLDPLELGGSDVWMLRTKLRFSVRAVGALSCCATFPALLIHIYEDENWAYKQTIGRKQALKIGHINRLQAESKPFL